VLTVPKLGVWKIGGIPSFLVPRREHRFASRALSQQQMGSLGSADEKPKKVKWTYTFHANNRLTRLPLMLFAKSQWNGYMAVCMRA
jgi:hypothetical protein